MRLLLVFLLACSHAAPKPVEPPHVAYVSPPSCNLPELPEPIAPTIVGWPTPDEIVVSKSDMVAVLSYVQALHDWVFAAAACIQAGRK
jgi:hypothetical protein